MLYPVDAMLNVSNTFRIVKVQVFSILIAALTISTGCGTPSATSSNPTKAPDLTGNWQIDSTLPTTSIPVAAVVLFGALQSSGSHVQGTFRFANLAQPSCGLNQVVALAGEVDANNNLSLTSSTLPNGTTIKALLEISASQPYTGAGFIEVNGATCSFASAPAIGEKIADATGTYVGAFTPGTIVAPSTGAPGNITLTLTQSIDAQSDGQFAAAASLNYQFGSCSGNVALNGYVSGVGVNMSSLSGTFQTLQNVEVIGTINPTASKITAPYLSFSPAPCSADPLSNAIYNGELNRP